MIYLNCIFCLAVVRICKSKNPYKECVWWQGSGLEKKARVGKGCWAEETASAFLCKQFLAPSPAKFNRIQAEPWTDNCCAFPYFPYWSRYIFHLLQPLREEDSSKGWEFRNLLNYILFLLGNQIMELCCFSDPRNRWTLLVSFAKICWNRDGSL